METLLVHPCPWALNVSWPSGQDRKDFPSPPQVRGIPLPNSQVKKQTGRIQMGKKPDAFLRAYAP